LKKKKKEKKKKKKKDGGCDAIVCCCFLHDICGSRLRLMYGCEREWSSMAMTEIQVLCWGRLNAEFLNVSCQITCLLDDVCKFKISQG
jgi:hypothetical protein